MLLIVGLVGFNFLSAQFEFGLRTGMSTQEIGTEEITLDNVNQLKLGLANASYGYHFGVYGQFKLAGLTITPEVILNSNNYEYKLQEFNESGGFEKVIKDSYQYLDIPVLVGVKLGPLRAYAGPEIHYFVNSFSKLATEAGFSEQIDKLNYGAIAGAGLNIGRLRFDLRYELNFSDFEDNITYNNSEIDFNSDDSRWIFSLGYKLF